MLLYPFSNYRYWYMALASCWRSKSTEICEWYRKSPLAEIKLHYDIWLVNGHPGNDTKFFSHQLSLDQQGLPQIFIFFTSLYSLLTLGHLLIQKIPRHPVILLLTVCLLLQFVAISFGCAHHVLYASDGVGEPILRACGRCLDEVVQCLFVLLLLLLARGWRITRVDVRQKRLLFGVWSGYSSVYLTLVLLSVVSVIIFLLHEYKIKSTLSLSNPNMVRVIQVQEASKLPYTWSLDFCGRWGC